MRFKVYSLLGHLHFLTMVYLKRWASEQQADNAWYLYQWELQTTLYLQGRPSSCSSIFPALLPISPINRTDCCTKEVLMSSLHLRRGKC